MPSVQALQQNYQAVRSSEPASYGICGLHSPLCEGSASSITSIGSFPVLTASQRPFKDARLSLPSREDSSGIQAISDVAGMATNLSAPVAHFAFHVEPAVELQEMLMNLTVTGHHIDVTSSMRNYVTDKMQRLLRRYDRVFGVHVILSVEKMRQKAEATIKVAGTQLYADTTEPDMYAAIDLLTDKLDRQLIKHKEKLQTHRRSANEQPLEDED